MGKFEQWFNDTIEKQEKSFGYKSVLGDAGRWASKVIEAQNKLETVRLNAVTKRGRAMEQFTEGYRTAEIERIDNEALAGIQSVLAPLEATVATMANNLYAMTQEHALAPITAEISLQLDNLEKIDFTKEDFEHYAEAYKKTPLAMKRLQGIAKAKGVVIADPYGLQSVNLYSLEGEGLTAPLELACRLAKRVWNPINDLRNYYINHVQDAVYTAISFSYFEQGLQADLDADIQALKEILG